VYTKGPLYAAAGYQGQDSNNRLFVLTGAYDFTVAKIYLNTAQARGGFNGGSFGGPPAPGYRAKSFSGGVSAPVGPGRLFAQAGRYDPSGSGVGLGPISKSTKFGLGYEYNLSKRTALYSTVATAKKDSFGATSFSRANAFDLGVWHRF
jgi:predicted porin